MDEPPFAAQRPDPHFPALVARPQTHQPDRFGIVAVAEQPLGGGGVARVGLLALATIPFVVDGQRAIVAILVIAGVRALVSMLAHPSWVSIFAAVVPPEARAKYAARRSLGISLVAMAAVPAMGNPLGN